MRKEFNTLKEELWAGRTYDKEGVDNWAEIETLLINLENKIDEVEKRIECATRSAQEANDSISMYTGRVDREETFKMDVRDHDSILRGTNDVIIALNMKDAECIENNWYSLFKTEKEPKPIAVGNVEYEFPEEVYSIGNADNTEIIGDVYESVFKLLLQGTVVITENDKGFTSGKTNYIITHEQFIPLIKFHQIDLSKVPIKREVFMTFESSWGEITCDKDGNVIEVFGDKEEDNYLYDIAKFDLAEYFEFLNSIGQNVEHSESDILSVSFWKKDNTYDAADQDWRNSFYINKNEAPTMLCQDNKNEAPTMLCQDNYKHEVVKHVVEKLKDIDVDGETLQYIIEQLGMNDQMLRQLVLTNPYTDTADLLKEKEENKFH